MDANTVQRVSTAPQRTQPFLSKYEILSLLGKGAFGTAHVVRRRGHKTKYCAKQIHFFTDGTSFDPRRLKMAVNEVKVLSTLTHANIVKYIGAVEEADCMWIITEYVGGGDLHKFISRHRHQGVPIERGVALSFTMQLLRALQYLHSNGVLHRDVKPANIFLNSARDAVQLGDFGLTKVLGEEASTTTVCGTPLYYAPELCASAPYTAAADMWALGCVVFEMLALRHPFDAGAREKTFANILSVKFTPPADVDPLLFGFVQRVLVRDPSQRLTAAQTINFLNGEEVSGLSLAVVNWVRAHVAEPEAQEQVLGLVRGAAAASSASRLFLVQQVLQLTGEDPQFRELLKSEFGG